MVTDLGRRFSLLLTLSLLTLGCTTVRPVDPFLASRLGELLLVGFRGTEVEGNQEVVQLVCDLKIGGVILFERDIASGTPRNITGPEQLQRLTGDLQALARECTGRPLLIAADSEGGEVMRLSPRVGYAPTPSARELGELGDLAVTELEARRIGGMLRKAGITWNLAPVVDLALNPLNPVIAARGRAFARDPERVTAQARAFLMGMKAAGLLTALKHFPGHGSSREDSHRGFVDVTDTAPHVLELLPYVTLISEGLVDSVMTAHVVNRKLDPVHPATLSRPIVHGLLRAELAFQGVVVSDDLLMGAIVNHFGLEEAAILALTAGVDVLLISQDLRDGESTAVRVLKALTAALASGRLSRDRIEGALNRIEQLRSRALAPERPQERSDLRARGK
ncbi:MAG: glycoside hydrolase family 3 N-terminal domain-containing protein [Candidatus Methylomirabilia bacterium]